MIEAEAPFAPLREVAASATAHYGRALLSAATAYPKARLIRRDFRLPLLDMTVWFSSARLAALAERTLITREAGEASTHVEVYALDPETAAWELPATLEPEPGFSTRKLEQVLAADGLRGFYHGESRSWQFFDGASATGVVSLPEELGLPPWELGSPLRLFLHWGAAAAGHRLTHAATLGRAGRGLLIAAVSGSGKSGTALAGILHGLDSAGDDYVVVQRANAAVFAYPAFALFKQDREGLRRAGMAERFRDATLNWHGKVEFDPSALTGRTLAPRLEIVAVLIPEVAHAARTAFAPARASEAALALAPSGVLQLPGDTQAGFHFLADLARRLPAFRLSLSEDPGEIAAAIGAFLAEGVR